LNEIARQSQVAMEIIESRVMVQAGVAAACEALGLEVFKVANEGKMIIIVAPQDAAKALFIIRRSPYGETARVIGKVHKAPAGLVQVRTVIGTARILDPPSGDLLPRIC
jgi:hydrogenase expression/formation protein HypE